MKFIKRNMNIYNPMNHPSVILRREALEIISYSDMRYFEDYYLWLRLLNFSKGYNLNESLVYARVGNDMVGRRQGISFFKKEIRFQFTIYVDGLQTMSSCLKNIIFRAIPRLLPKFILKIIYNSFLRN